LALVLLFYYILLLFAALALPLPSLWEQGCGAKGVVDFYCVAVKIRRANNS
jgi:hypothetical protein